MSGDETSRYTPVGTTAEHQHASDRQKPASRIWAIRIYAIVALVCWNGAGVWALWYFFTFQDDRAFILPFSLAPMGISVVLFGVGLFMFPFRYSALGSYIRTAWPSDPPVYLLRSFWVEIGRGQCSGVVVRWHVFSDGLGIRIPVFGSLFLPYTSFRDVKRTWWGAYAVNHNWPEARSPITMPADVWRRLYEVVMRSPQSSNLTSVT